MRKTTLLKTFLLLCALMVGGSVWAQSDYSTTYTTGEDLTLPSTVAKVKINNDEYTAYKLGSSSTAGSLNITVPSGTKYLHLHVAGWNNESVTLTMKNGSNAITTINLTSDSGISGNGPTYTIKDADKCSTDYYKVVTFSNALSQDIQFTFTATSGKRFVVWGVNAEEASPFTITVESNNDSYGTVSLSGSTITASPATGYRVSTTNPYAVTPEGSATVSQSGNTFTVTPSANTTVTINFEAIPTHTVTFSVNGTTSTATVAEGAAIEFPSNPADVNGMTFVGWYTNTYDDASVAPDFVTSATMGDSDVTYYAVFANAETTQASENKELTITPSDFTNLTSSYSEVSTTKSIDGVNYTITIQACKQNAQIQMRDNQTISYIHIPVLPGIITNVSTTQCNNASGSAYSGTIHLKSSKTRGNTDDDDIVKQALSSVNAFNIEMPSNSDVREFYLVTSAGLRLSNLTVNYQVNSTTTTYFDYCTTVPDPAITLSTASIEASAAGADGTINVTYTAIDLSETPAVEWYTDANATTTMTTAPNWLDTEINSDNNLYYVIEENTGAARTAFMKVYAIDANGEDLVYSELITVTQAAATVTATVGAKGFATFVSDKALDFTGKSIKAYTINSTDGSALTLTQKDQVAANEPVLLYSETASDSQDIPVIASATADSNNKLVRGTGDAITWSETNPVYVLNTTNTPAFYRANNSPVATNKAYLDLTGVNPSRSFFTLSLDGEVQGISNMNRETTTNNSYFDLQGRRVAQPIKGMYIVNGKKVVVK